MEFESELQWELTILSIFLPLSFTHLSVMALVEARNKPIKMMQIVTIVLSVIIDIVIVTEMLINIPAPWPMLSPLLILIAVCTVATLIINPPVVPPKTDKRQK